MFDTVPDQPIRIGTRGSPLALAQAHEVRDRLMAAADLPESAFAIEIIRTTGDRIQDRPLAEAGGKGLFTKEIEEALLAGTIDLAVHSMKDVPTYFPDGLGLASVLPREDVRDAFISLAYGSLAAMPQGAVLGTSSLRRGAQIRRRRPDLRIVQFRGNVQTRLRKLAEGVADATLLAVAGLNRLGMADRITAAMSPDEMLPAIAQGAVGVEIRLDDARMADLVGRIDCRDTATRVTAERAFLARLEGSCRTPIAGLAELTGERLTFRGEVLTPDGTAAWQVAREGAAGDAARIGQDAAEEILATAGADVLTKGA
ncbi:MAG: hydroxymethylbilane synthase [Hyphomicrobiaceae bacterium]